MPFAPFYYWFPEIAPNETRVFIVPKDYDSTLPAGEYALVEYYCNERKCDCRRVIFNVIGPTPTKQAASLGYGWETYDFYRKWFTHGSSEEVKTMMGVSPMIMAPQTQLTPILLQMVQKTIDTDPVYVERIKNHYRMVREIIDGPSLDLMPRSKIVRKPVKKRR